MSGLACLMLVPVGCRDEAPERPSTPEVFRPPDPGEPRVAWTDAQSGLSFERTGRWARLEPAALESLGPDVRLGVAEGKRCRGWALVRPAAEVTTRAAAAAARQALAWDELKVRVDEFVKYDIWTARRYEVRGRVDGRVTEERATWWIDHGKLYAVVARTDERDFNSRRRCLDRVTAGFVLRDPSP